MRGDEEKTYLADPNSFMKVIKTRVKAPEGIK